MGVSTVGVDMVSSMNSFLKDQKEYIEKELDKIKYVLESELDVKVDHYLMALPIENDNDKIFLILEFSIYAPYYGKETPFEVSTRIQHLSETYDGGKIAVDSKNGIIDFIQRCHKNILKMIFFLKSCEFYNPLSGEVFNYKSIEYMKKHLNTKKRLKGY